MSASLKVLGSKLPSECFFSSGKIRSFSAWSKCGNSHCSVNSARCWYHHHVESKSRFSSSWSSVSTQWTRVYAETWFVVTRVSGVGSVAASRYCLMCSPIFSMGCMIENDSRPSPSLPATADEPSLVAAIHAGGGGALEGVRGPHPRREGEVGGLV